MGWNGIGPSVKHDKGLRLRTTRAGLRLTHTERLSRHRIPGHEQSQLRPGCKRRSTRRSCSTSRLRVSMVDDGGRVLLQLRHPRATIASGDSPFAKARTAVRLGVDAGARPPTSPLVPAFVAGVPWPFAVFPGGLVRRNSASQIVDAGESVDPTEDARVATAAGEALSTDI